MSADLSIIIPTRDRLWSLPKAVESCRSSTLIIEIIVIDDASTDGTAEWLIGQTDLMVIQGEGWGKPWGVNKALSRATGTYVRFLDSDDWLAPGANERQFELAESQDADLVVAGLDLYLEETFSERMPWIPTDDFISQQLGETAGSHYSAFLFRRSFVQDIPHRTLFPASDFASRDDRCFILEVALRDPRIAVCEEPTLCHRHHSKSRLQFASGLRSSGTLIQQLYIFKQIVFLLDSAGRLNDRRKVQATKALWTLAHWIAYSHIDDAGNIADWIYKLDEDFVPPENNMLGGMYRRLGFRKTEKILRVRRQFILYMDQIKNFLLRFDNK